MHHTILGAGGVGGLIGSVLARSGEQVTLLVRPETATQQPRHLSLESKFGTFTVPVGVSAKLAAPTDILWITVKGTQLEPALKQIANGSPIGHVVPLLNGIDHIPLLRERFGRDQVIPATIAVESERTGPGKIVHRSPFVRLNAAASGRASLEPVMELFSRFGFECKFIENESTLLWSKLAFLAPVALSTTAAGLPIGGVLGDPEGKVRLEACVREACAVANAGGADLNADAITAAVNTLPAGMRSSMQKDVEAGRLPELDAIAGPIMRGAARHHLQATATGELVEAIRKKIGESDDSTWGLLGGREAAKQSGTP